jgi:hypothetical protein
MPVWGFEPRSPWSERYVFVRPTPYQLHHCNCWTPDNFLININLMSSFLIIKSLPQAHDLSANLILRMNTHFKTFTTIWAHVEGYTKQKKFCNGIENSLFFLQRKSTKSIKIVCFVFQLNILTNSVSGKRFRLCTFVIFLRVLQQNNSCKKRFLNFSEQYACTVKIQMTTIH